jgi:hypothetical protein
MTDPLPQRQPRRRPAVSRDGAQRVADSIDRNFTSPNEWDRNGEEANVVDALAGIARAIHHLAEAVEGLSHDPTA